MSAFGIAVEMKTARYPDHKVVNVVKLMEAVGNVMVIISVATMEKDLKHVHRVMLNSPEIKVPLICVTLEQVQIAALYIY